MIDNIKNIKKLLDDATLKLSVCLDNAAPYRRWVNIYTLMFNEYPHRIGIISDGKYLNSNVNDVAFGNYNRPYSEFEFDNELIGDEDDNTTTFENVAIQSTLIKLCEHFKDSTYIVRNNDMPIIIGDKLIIFYDTYDDELYVLQDSPELRSDVKDCIVDDKFDKKIRIVSYITHDNMGFNKTKIQVNNQETDINKFYNDDLPDKEIFEFLNGNTSGLLLLHGDAGTGKTSYIRHLMYRLKHHEFMVLDNSVFAYITDASFIKLLMTNKNSIIILEDCEEMLADRVAGNSRISALLNLSDGILGDSFRFKFICTFNTSISKIDQALLRKGRMKMKYEFKKLCAEKTYALGQKLGKNIPKGEEHTLADIFNYGVSNGNKTTKSTIGFGA